MLVFTIADAYNEFGHEKEIQRIKSENPNAYNYLIEEPTSLGARFKFDANLGTPNKITVFVKIFNWKNNKYRYT